MQDGRKAVWSIPYVSVASFFPSLKHNFIAYPSFKVSDCIFEIHQLWQSGFSRVYSNYCCSCWFEAEIIKIGQSSHKMYSNNIVNFQESTTILNTYTKKVWKLIVMGHILPYPKDGLVQPFSHLSKEKIKYSLKKKKNIFLSLGKKREKKGQNMEDLKETITRLIEFQLDQQKLQLDQQNVPPPTTESRLENAENWITTPSFNK